MTRKPTHHVEIDHRSIEHNWKAEAIAAAFLVVLAVLIFGGL